MYIYICINICVHICIRVCAYVCIFIYIYTYTQHQYAYYIYDVGTKKSYIYVCAYM